MPRIKERWRRLSKRWRLVIIILTAIIVLGGAGVAWASVALENLAENPAACGRCHLMQPYVDSYYKSNFIDSVHAKAVMDVKCKNCHQVTLLQQTKQLVSFVTGSYEIPLKQNVQAQKFCSDCHPAKEITAAVRSRPDFAENPLFSYHLTAEEGKIGCRDLRAELVRCQDCHRVHRAGVNYCATCHSSSFSAPSK